MLGVAEAPSVTAVTNPNGYSLPFTVTVTESPAKFALVTSPVINLDVLFGSTTCTVFPTKLFACCFVLFVFLIEYF